MSLPASLDPYTASQLSLPGYNVPSYVSLDSSIIPITGQAIGGTAPSSGTNNDPYKGDNPLQQWIYNHTMVGHNPFAYNGPGKADSPSGFNADTLITKFGFVLLAVVVIAIGLWAAVKE